MSPGNGFPSHSDGPRMVRLTAWAKTRGLEVVVSLGSQREPENVVAVRRGSNASGTTVISRSSLDSIETAAFYLLNALDLLGVELPLSPPTDP